MTQSLEEPGPLDAQDGAILAQMRQIYGRMDPAPATLPDRIKYAITVRMLEAEVAELTRMPMAVVRSESGDRFESVSFTGSRLSLMVSAAAEPDGLRVDCWVTLGGAVVEIRFAGGSGHPERAEVCDTNGRCVFTQVPSGLAHFIVWPDQEKSSPPTITPTIEL